MRIRVLFVIYWIHLLLSCNPPQIEHIEVDEPIIDSCPNKPSTPILPVKPEKPNKPQIEILDTKDIINIKIEDKIMAIVGNNSWNHITYGNGKYVVCAIGGSVAYSSDGKSWNITTLDIKSTDNPAIVFANSKFYIFSNNKMFESVNGIDWTQNNAPYSKDFDAVTYGGGKFVAYWGKNVMYSVNGTTWLSTNVPNAGTGAVFTGVIFVNGIFVLTEIRGFLLYSTDGINWNRSTAENHSWKGVAYGNGKFVALSSDGIMAHSTNGIDWNISQSPFAISITNWTNIAYGNGKFVYLGYKNNVGNNDKNTYISTSTDGINWSDPIQTENEEGAFTTAQFNDILII